jgi:hypothetical protein
MATRCHSFIRLRRPTLDVLKLRHSIITAAAEAIARHTQYDSLLMSGVSREDARDRIRSAVDRILAAWAQPA